MALTKATYSQGPSLQFQDCTTSTTTVADGTLRQRCDIRAFPQKGIKYTGHLGDQLTAPVLTKGSVAHNPAVAVVNGTVGTTGVAAVWTVTVSNSPTSGTFTLSYGGNTTTALVITSTAAQVQTALNLLAGVAVTVTGSTGGPFTVTWSAVGVRTALTAADTFNQPGTFASGTYYWVVTAIGSAWSGRGETDVSNEVTATLLTDDSQPLTWAAVPDAAAYNVYRGTVTATEDHLIATVTALAYTDTGSAGTAATLPTANTTGYPVPAAARPEHGAGS
jgi:hypothetical protein